MKKNQLVDLYETVDEYVCVKDHSEIPTNVFEKQTDFDSLSELIKVLESSPFAFLAKSQEAKYLLQIQKKTVQLTEEFSKMREAKRDESFKIGTYFSLLEQVQKSGMPLQASILEAARAESKKEKWVKKYNET
eukprot:CAMPEP_0170488088 /NCGR_PEP_ID=MMETSP0208-20121228/6711_1 /TAXON_ID=197538 /ORGANISM="Strombidium inclinatum, Strain S3" /LENGTH=132 /DNA_ID=CAMNT_0010762531 /DNA_START=2987 /DNA_END=3385 /DNA_ORIENTATION=-